MTRIIKLSIHHIRTYISSIAIPPPTLPRHSSTPAALEQAQQKIGQLFQPKVIENICRMVLTKYLPLQGLLFRFPLLSSSPVATHSALCSLFLFFAFSLNRHLRSSRSHHTTHRYPLRAPPLFPPSAHPHSSNAIHEFLSLITAFPDPDPHLHSQPHSHPSPPPPHARASPLRPPPSQPRTWSAGGTAPRSS